MYEKINIENLQNSGVKVIDLRSDTISKPTPEMREAMASAEVGDDVYNEDPTVAELEKRAAELLGKEEALFVVSGTMANLLAVMVHCNQRGSELISGDNGHTFKFEQGGTAHIAGVHTSTIKNNDDGTFSLDELRKKIRKNPDMHEPVTSLIIVENTHNLCGGKVVPLEWLEKVSNIAADHNVPIHMDGARMMNAAVYLKLHPSRIARDVDSVCFCLSKGLGCPVGALLAGTSSFIADARRVRKAIGGAWRQAGIIAAAGLVALDTMIDRLEVDHKHAYQIAKAIYACKSNNFKVDMATVQSNIVIMYLNRSKIQIKDLQRRLQTVLTTDSVKCSVRCSTLNFDCVRFVIYWEVSDEDIKMACDKIQLVIREYDEMFKIFLAISDLKSATFKAATEIHTNIVIMYMDPKKVKPQDVKNRLIHVKRDDPVKVAVKGSQREDWIRFVTYWEMTDNDIKLAIEKIKLVLKEFDDVVSSSEGGSPCKKIRLS